jgi:hypothetical protein
MTLGSEFLEKKEIYKRFATFSGAATPFNTSSYCVWLKIADGKTFGDLNPS